MDKRKVISVVIVLMLCLTIYKLNLNKINNNQEIEKTKQSVKVNRKQFAMFIKENGVYKEYTSSDKFPEGYVIDKNMSKCYDANNQEIDEITFTSNNNNITVTSGKTAYCYLYFKEPTGGNSILGNLPADSGLSTGKLGDMRRYQGTSAKNYICINDTGAKCNSGSNEMYRIIGIVDSGTDEGQIKAIKETKYGNTYAWNNKTYTSDCSGTTCSWPNNDLAKTLNSTFLNSLPTKVQNVIVAKQWYYGDIGWDYANKDAATIYQIETGATNTTYYDMSGSLISNQKWQKTSGTSKIGLMYLHDYYWQSTATNCHSSSSTYSQCKSNGWMHLSQNGNTSDSYEWTMSRIGRYSSSSAYVNAWRVYSDGTVYGNRLDYAYAVRPVFYLSSDVRIKEGGTGEKTNPYILDLS